MIHLLHYFEDVVIGRYVLSLASVRFHGRDRVARVASERLAAFYFIFAYRIQQFGEDHAEAPDVGGLVVIIIGEGHLGGTVVPRLYVRRPVSLLLSPPLSVLSQVTGHLILEFLIIGSA